MVRIEVVVATDTGQDLADVRVAIAVCEGLLRGYRFLREESRGSAAAAFRAHQAYIALGCEFRSSVLGELACLECSDCRHFDSEADNQTHPCEFIRRSALILDTATSLSARAHGAASSVLYARECLGVLKQHERRLRRGKHVKAWREERAEMLVAIYVDRYASGQP